MKNIFFKSCTLFLSLILMSCTSLNKPKMISNDKPCEPLPLSIKWKAPQISADNNQILRKINGYKVFIKAAKNKNFEEFIIVKDKTSLVFDHSRLTPNTEYDIRVIAFNDAGEGEPSKVFRIKTCGENMKKEINNDK